MGRDLKLKSNGFKERYYWYKERGICASCGRVWAEPGKVYCKACTARNYACHEKRREERIETQRRRRAERIAAGICTQCGKRPATEGKKMCPRCRAMRNDSSRKYRIQQRIKRDAERIRQQRNRKEKPREVIDVRKGVLTQSEISRATGVGVSTVSLALRDIKPVPQDGRGRYNMHYNAQEALEAVIAFCENRRQTILAKAEAKAAKWSGYIDATRKLMDV